MIAAVTTTCRLPSPVPLNLTIVSWNICETCSSSSAPDPIQRSRESCRLIRDQCLSHQPDIIALQETPYPFWGDEYFAPFGYVSMGNRLSHCGYVDLLLRQEMALESHSIKLHKNLPSVATKIVLPNGTSMALSSSHLSPFAQGMEVRKRQCEVLVDSLLQECENCIHLGDYNMRVAEDKTIENLCGGGWIDMWKGSGSSSLSKFSWNTFQNKYYKDGRQYKARYDRCYMRGEALSLLSYSLMGNEPVQEKDGGGGVGDYLSDHFGLLVKIQVAATECSDDE